MIKILVRILLQLFAILHVFLAVFIAIIFNFAKLLHSIFVYWICRTVCLSDKRKLFLVLLNVHLLTGLPIESLSASLNGASQTFDLIVARLIMLIQVSISFKRVNTFAAFKRSFVRMSSYVSLQVI